MPPLLRRMSMIASHSLIAAVAVENRVIQNRRLSQADPRAQCQKDESADDTGDAPLLAAPRDESAQEIGKPAAACIGALKHHLQRRPVDSGKISRDAGA